MFYPEVIKLSIAKTEQVSEDAPANQQILLVKLNTTNKKPAVLRDTLTTWAKKRLQNDNLVVLISPITATTP
ncbi:MAG: hypothetical protein IPL02_03975 [Moraxellaceae bacterium]|nr:hypothetical protein [Moraxellaceae bacterium]